MPHKDAPGEPGAQPGCLHPTQTRGRIFPSNFAFSSAVGAGRGRLDYRSFGLWAKAIHSQRGRDYEKVAIWESAHRIHTQDPKTNSLTSSPHLFLSK